MPVGPRRLQTAPVVLADTGVENVNAQVDALIHTGVLRRLLAFTELKFSNSMIEAWWRSLKDQWLFLHSLDSVTTVRRLVRSMSTNTTACFRIQRFTDRRLGERGHRSRHGELRGPGDPLLVACHGRASAPSRGVPRMRAGVTAPASGFGNGNFSGWRIAPGSPSRCATFRRARASGTRSSIACSRTSP